MGVVGRKAVVWMGVENYIAIASKEADAVGIVVFLFKYLGFKLKCFHIDCAILRQRYVFFFAFHSFWGEKRVVYCCCCSDIVLGAIRSSSSVEPL